MKIPSKEPDNKVSDLDLTNAHVVVAGHPLADKGPRRSRVSLEDRDEDSASITINGAKIGADGIPGDVAVPEDRRRSCRTRRCSCAARRITQIVDDELPANSRTQLNRRRGGGLEDPIG